ncbi:MAG: protein O-mannosyl-transferase family [Polyangiales bacterium]
MRSSLGKGLLAGIPPLLAYLSTASGYAHWLDSGEFVAVAADFGISHPPGHPLAAVVLGLANVLPFGALSFRAAVICAILLSIAAAALCFAIESSLKVTDAIRPSLRFPLALAATWWVVGSQGWWFQAVRPEVYALQAALLCIGVERLLRVSTSGEGGDVRPLYQAALVLGLALANHHYIALLAIIPSLWLFFGIAKTWGWRPFAWSTAFVSAGLLTYLYLPLRALKEPFLNLGDPSSFGRFAWVVSAQAFQKSVSPEVVAPFGETLADVLIATAENLHPLMLAVALLGAYFMLRVKDSRKYGLFWLTLWLVYVLGRAMLGFVRGNPDAIAYFMLSYAALAAFAAFAFGVLLSALAEAAPNRARLAPVLGALVVIGSAFQFVRSAEASSLASFADTDVFDDGLRRALPARSVVLAHNPQTIFRYWGGEAEELNRPDVTMIPLPLLSYPKLIDRFVRDEPELKALLRSYALDGTLSAPELQSLASLRPVYVEMDVRVTREMMDLVVPEHLYHRVLTADTTDTDEAGAMREHAKLWASLYQRIGQPIDEHSEVQLIWRHYTDSLYFAGVGDTNAALRTVAAALALNPHPPELQRLREALKQAEPGERIDVTPFTIR